MTPREELAERCRRFQLRIITAEHKCGVPRGPETPEEQARCDRFDHPVSSPHHFIVHQVSHLTSRGTEIMAAHSKEGDWTMGTPEDLLVRLMQAREAGA